MKLDIDCIRDILMEFETFPFGIYTVLSFEKSLSKHGEENVTYSLSKLTEAGYINAEFITDHDGRPDFMGIYAITFAGHEFLNSIRQPSIWDKMKDAFQGGGTASVEVIKDIAVELLKESARVKLGLK